MFYRIFYRSLISEICNVDQTECNYEFLSTRTLTDKGEKCTILTVKALCDCSHSYTVMPVIFKNGRIFPKILIFFQEINGKFGPIVEIKLTERISQLHVVDLENYQSLI